MKKEPGTPTIDHFLQGKSAQTLALFLHFTNTYATLAPVAFLPAKTMIGIKYGKRRVAWITALGKNFVHVVFPFKQSYPDNLCFIKIAQVPGTAKYNHHFRMYATDDVTEEVVQFMRLALTT